MPAPKKTAKKAVATKKKSARRSTSPLAEATVEESRSAGGAASVEALVVPPALQPAAAVLAALAPAPAAGLCDRGEEVEAGIIVLRRAADTAVFDFYVCKMNADVDIVLSAAAGQDFKTMIVRTSGQSHAGLNIPVATMPPGPYSLVWQFTGITPPDWLSCAEFTRTNAVIFRVNKNASSRPPKDHGSLTIQVQG